MKKQTYEEFCQVAEEKGFWAAVNSGPTDEELKQEREKQRKDKLDRWARDEYTAGESFFFGLSGIVSDVILEKLIPFDETMRRANNKVDLMQKIANMMSTLQNVDQAIKLLEAEKLKQETRKVAAQADVEEANAEFTINELRRLKDNK